MGRGGAGSGPLSNKGSSKARPSSKNPKTPVGGDGVPDPSNIGSQDEALDALGDLDYNNYSSLQDDNPGKLKMVDVKNLADDAD